MARRYWRRSTPELALVVALAGAGAAAAATAEAGDLSLTIDLGQQYNYSDGYDALSVDDQAPYNSVGLAFEVYEHLHVGAEYEFGFERDPLFGLDLEYGLQAAVLQVRYEYPVTSWFQPHVRVGAGAYFSDVELVADGVTYEASDVGFGFYALGGFDLLWRVGGTEPQEGEGFLGRLALGVSNDWGWAHRPDATFDELVPVGADSAAPVDLGTVALQGWTWRFGVQLRYEL